MDRSNPGSPANDQEERKIFVARGDAEVRRCFPVMAELRPHLGMESFLHLYEEAHKRDGFEIAAVESGGEILAVMGYRVLYDYVRGKHLYIDDLVSSEKARSRGLGAELLRFAEEKARELGCPTLRLCTGIENERGMRFYDREGWVKRAFAYTKKLE